MEKKLDINKPVYLTSGSHAMTIQVIEKDIVYCQWFDGSEFKEQDFAPHQLTNKNPNAKKKPSIRKNKIN